MKNPHGVEPTRFMKRREIQYAIERNSKCGPTFFYYGSDICIDDKCNKEYNCYIHNDGTNTYEYHPQYKNSLFVGTAGPDETNYFSVLDYEVFAIDYESKYTIDHLCKYPDIMWEYMETKDISEESLKQVDDDTELFNDLDTIHCEDHAIRLKISKYCLRNPSELLPNTQIVSQQYDDKLREWCGSGYKWKLLYRASEHGYSAESFHKCCDNKGPTLIIIKSIEGWIFGGYTIRSWKVVHPDIYGCIYNDMIYS